MKEKQRRICVRNVIKGLNEHHGKVCNGKNLYVVVNGHVRKRRDDGRRDFKVSIDMQKLLNDSPNKCCCLVLIAYIILTFLHNYVHSYNCDYCLEMSTF